jgi:tetratricopeptide (TPR) repeat protein
MAQKKEGYSYYNLEILQKADGYFNSGDYYNALSNYRKVIKKSPGDTTVILKIAECYKLLNVFDDSEIWYAKILGNNTDVTVDAKHILDYAQILTINGKYSDALYWYKEYYSTDSDDPRGIAGMKTIENLTRLYYDTMFYVVFPVNINTVYNEFSPVFYNDGLIFISDRPRAKVTNSDKGKNSGYSKWYYSASDESGRLGDPVQFNRKQNIKTRFNEGPIVFYDNQSRMIYTQNSDAEEKKKDQMEILPVQLFSAVTSDGVNWSEFRLLDFFNKKYSYGQPAITSDGKILIFSSDNPEGFGGSDLYSSTFEKGLWQEPINLGVNINTPGDEMFPYILNDSILFFSSDGHGGLGGLDICYASLPVTDSIVNLGFPVNSSRDDFGIMYDKDGMSGYFSSNRDGYSGNDNIFAFRIIRVSLTLRIIDIATSGPIAEARVISISGMDEDLIGETDQDGYCNVIIPVSKEIKIRIEKEDFESQVFTFEPMRYKTETSLVIHVDVADNQIVEETVKENSDVIYKVQVMASRKPATPRQIKRKYKGPLPVSVSFEDNWYKYTVGEFRTYYEACDCMRSTHVADAFVAGYINNTRVSIFFAKSKTNEPDACDNNDNRQY